MKLIRAIAIILLLIVSVGMRSAAALAADPQPADVLTGIYMEAVKGATADWLEPKRRVNYLSKSLLALWAKSDAKKVPKGDVGALDFDITTDTNALDLRDFRIKTESRSDAAAVLAVKMIYREPYVHVGPPRVVTYDFVHEGGAWRIDNIRGQGWSVRKILTAWLKGN
jgi:hypothetical protein